MSAGTPASRLMVLMFTDLVGSVDLKSRLGTVAYAGLLGRHDELFRRSIAGLPNASILQDTGDGFCVRFETASDAVMAALLFQHAMAVEPWGPEPLRARVGIHLGEVAEVGQESSPPGSTPGGDSGPVATAQPKLIGLTADLAARVMGLALGGQILLTRTAFNEARQFVREHPAVNGEFEHAPPPPLRWVAHGQYQFKGADEPVDIFEVGVPGRSPLTPPPDGQKARRLVCCGDEEEKVLGWRPAAGLEIPQRKGWVLERRLGEGGFGEVWLAAHVRTRERRVFKFCLDAERLRSLKR